VRKAALFIRHKALPGKRDQVRRVWEKHLQTQITGNPRHEAYFYCYDDGDPDALCVFQLYTDKEASQQFLKQPWYADYWNEVSPLLVGESDFRSANLQWAKVEAAEPSGE